MFTSDTEPVENEIDKNLSYSIYVSQESINTEKSGVKNLELSTIVTLPVLRLSIPQWAQNLRHQVVWN